MKNKTLIYRNTVQRVGWKQFDSKKEIEEWFNKMPYSQGETLRLGENKIIYKVEVLYDYSKELQNDNN